MTRFYLDYNATAPVRPEVRDSVVRALDLGNPSAVHEDGRKARAAVENARAAIASFCGAVPEGVVFTSGGTEACNLAMRLRAAPAGNVTRVLISAVEHAAVGQAALASGLEVTRLPVDARGVVDLMGLDEALAQPAGERVQEAVRVASALGAAATRQHVGLGGVRPAVGEAVGRRIQRKGEGEGG